MANEERNAQCAESDWNRQMCEAAAWCAAHNVPLKVGPGFVTGLDSIADVLEGAMAGAGEENVPDGVAMYMICLRETAMFIRLHGTIAGVAAMAREQLDAIQEKEQTDAPAQAAKKTAGRRAGKKARK